MRSVQNYKVIPNAKTARETDERNEYSDKHSMTKPEYIVYLHRYSPLKFLLDEHFVDHCCRLSIARYITISWTHPQ